MTHFLRPLRPPTPGTLRPSQWLEEHRSPLGPCPTNFLDYRLLHTLPAIAASHTLASPSAPARVLIPSDSDPFGDFP